jgi:hypothetical protein
MKGLGELTRSDVPELLLCLQVRVPILSFMYHLSSRGLIFYPEIKDQDRSETLVLIYQITRRHILLSHALQIQYRFRTRYMCLYSQVASCHPSKFCVSLASPSSSMHSVQLHVVT